MASGSSQVSQAQGTATWLTSSAARVNVHHQREATGILLYYWCNIWKERNRQVFYSTQKSTSQVAMLVKEVDLYRMAFREEML
jgi:hypothetical protein